MSVHSLFCYVDKENRYALKHTLYNYYYLSGLKTGYSQNNFVSCKLGRSKNL